MSNCRCLYVTRHNVLLPYTEPASHQGQIKPVWCSALVSLAELSQQTAQTFTFRSNSRDVDPRWSSLRQTLSCRLGSDGFLIMKRCICEVFLKIYVFSGNQWAHSWEPTDRKSGGAECCRNQSMISIFTLLVHFCFKCLQLDASDKVCGKHKTSL